MLTAFLFVTFILRRKGAPAAGRKQRIRGIGGTPSPWTLGQDTAEGPAWQVYKESAAGDNSLSSATCFICRNGGVAEGVINTHFFGPDGPGSASFARVRIGGISQEDLFVTSKPLKGSLPICAVNWNRMALTCISINPERGVYEAILDITPDEAEKRGIEH